MTRAAPTAYEVTRLNNGFDFLRPLQFLDYRGDQLPDPHTVISPDPAIDWSTIDTCGVVEDFPPRNTPPGGRGHRANNSLLGAPKVSCVDTQHDGEANSQKGQHNHG